MANTKVANGAKTLFSSLFKETEFTIDNVYVNRRQFIINSILCVKTRTRDYTDSGVWENIVLYRLIKAMDKKEFLQVIYDNFSMFNMGMQLIAGDKYINANIIPSFWTANNFKGDTSEVVDHKGNGIIINKRLEKVGVFTPNFSNSSLGFKFYTVEPDNCGLTLTLCEDGKYIYTDAEGKQVIADKFYSATEFMYGLAITRKDENSLPCYIDTKGNVLCLGINNLFLKYLVNLEFGDNYVI